jgi:hypothetical protein
MKKEPSNSCEAAPGKVSFLKKALRKKTVRILLGFLLLLILGEVLVRVLAPQPIIPRFVEFSPHGIRRNIAFVDGFHRTSEFECRIHTNSQGFRGTREYEPEPPGDTGRIVTIGDAHTLGVGVGDDETFSALLEKRLANRGQDVEVINMGVSGFGTAQELLQFRHVARDYNPDLVILGYFQNDQAGNISSGLFGIEEEKLVRRDGKNKPGKSIQDRIRAIPGYSLLEQHSHLLAFFRNVVGGNLLKENPEEDVDRENPWNGDHEDPLELTRLILNLMIEEVARSGAALLILNISHPMSTSFVYFPYDLDLNDHSMILDLTEPLGAGPEEGGPVFYESGAFATPLGHEVIAAEILEALPGLGARWMRSAGDGR